MTVFTNTILPIAFAVIIAICCAGCSTPKYMDDENLPAVASTQAAPDVHYKGISIAPGNQLIDATVLDADMNETSIAELADGKPTYLIFWEEWCPQCKAEFKFIESVYQDYKDKVNFIALHRMDPKVDDNAKALAFLEQNGCTMPIFYNVGKQATAAYGSPSIPTNIFVRSDGTVYDVYTDVYDMTEQEVRSCLDEICVQ